MIICNGKYYELCGRCLVERKDFICYHIKTGDRFLIGDRIVFEGRNLVVSEKETELSGGELSFRYLLTGKTYNTVPEIENALLNGISFTGEVISTKGENVELALDIDPGGGSGNTYGYAPASGNFMYCMPKKGTKATLYLGNGKEQDGIITGCVRTNGDSCEGMGSPENKSFQTEHGKGMDLHPGSMGFSGDGGSLDLTDGKGAGLESAGDLFLHAKKGIRIESGKEIHIRQSRRSRGWGRRQACA